MAAVLLGESGLLAAVIRWPWLIAAGVLIALRLGPAAAREDAVDGWDYGAAVDAAVGIGMPDRLARWLRPRRKRNTQENTEETTDGDL